MTGMSVLLADADLCLHDVPGLKACRVVPVREIRIRIFRREIFHIYWPRFCNCFDMILLGFPRERRKRRIASSFERIWCKPKTFKKIWVNAKQL